jgi:hypothetical protein
MKPHLHRLPVAFDSNYERIFAWACRNGAEMMLGYTPVQAWCNWCWRYRLLPGGQGGGRTLSAGQTVNVMTSDAVDDIIQESLDRFVEGAEKVKR